jgi:hypothetical protein
MQKFSSLSRLGDKTTASWLGWRLSPCFYWATLARSVTTSWMWSSSRHSEARSILRSAKHLISLTVTQQIVTWSKSSNLGFCPDIKPHLVTLRSAARSWSTASISSCQRRPVSRESTTWGRNFHSQLPGRTSVALCSSVNQLLPTGVIEGSTASNRCFSTEPQVRRNSRWRMAL